MLDKSTTIREAQKYLSKGQIDKALAEWEKILTEALDPNSYNTVGDLYLKKGDKRSAVECFHKAAKGFRADGFSLKALALYKKIINIDPSEADALTFLGELSEEKGLATDAIKYYLAAADLLSREMKKDKFLAVYERILSLAPTNIPLKEKVAGLFLKEGFISSAVTEYLHIAGLYAEKGDSEREVAYLTRALGISPDSREALLALCSAYEKGGDVRRALDHATRALALAPDDPDTLLRCALLSREAGRHNDALEYLNRITELRPLDPEPYRLIGDIYRAAGDMLKAWESYKTVVGALVGEQRFSEASELAREFRALDPEGVGALLISLYRKAADNESVYEELVTLANFLVSLARHEEALAYYREALETHSDVQLRKKVAELEIKMGLQPSKAEEEKTIEYLLVDADIFVKYGLYDEARSILEELKVREPVNPDVRLRLKSLYRETDDREQAVTECIVLADLYERDGDNGKREAVLNEALEINPEDPRLLERISSKAGKEPVIPATPEETALDDYSEEMAEAEFYLRQGLSQDALRIYQKLRDLFPDNAELQGKIFSLEGAAQEPVESEEQMTPVEEPEFEEFTLSEPEALEEPAPIEPQLENDVLEIFEEFKKGLEKELEEEDYETHYNLGIAYKEMGLTEDAIKEFQTSRKDPEYFVRSMSMLGICYMEKELYPLAIDAFKGTLPGIETRDESFWGAKYDLAEAYEKNGNLKEALDLFREIYGWDSQFREIAEKLSTLKAPTEKTAPVPSEKERKNRISYL